MKTIDVKSMLIGFLLSTTILVSVLLLTGNIEMEVEVSDGESGIKKELNELNNRLWDLEQEVKILEQRTSDEVWRKLIKEMKWRIGMVLIGLYWYGHYLWLSVSFYIMLVIGDK